MAAPLVPLLILGGAAAFLFLSGRGGKKRPGEPGGPPLTSQQEAALLMPSSDNKALLYKPEARQYIVQALRTKEIQEGGQFGEAGEMTVARLIERGQAVEPGNSAYEGAKALHSMGNNIWVTPTMLTADAGERQLMAAPKGVNPPPASFLALLVSFADTWPEPSLPAPPAEQPPPPPANA